MSRYAGINDGYHDCPCRDCFDIAIGAEKDGSPSLCRDCEDAGCSPDDVECEREDAYGMDDEDTSLSTSSAE